jgi:hypothetical protein
MSDPRIPKHLDHARALRALLAAMNNDMDAVVLVSRETQTDESVDRFLLALLNVSSAFMKRRLEDPVGYVEAHIALELQLAEDEGEI